MSRQYILFVFKFENGSKLRAALPVADDTRDEQRMTEARKVCWRGDETAGRGPVASFTREGVVWVDLP